MAQKIRVGILGATGMVGQRFINLLENHPWFDVVSVAASSRSAGKPYAEAVKGRWQMPKPIPAAVSGLQVKEVQADKIAITKEVDLVFSALDLDKDSIKRIEEEYAAAGIPVVSNNSAHRWTEDVPMLMPEINPEHLTLIDEQRRRRGWTTGLIAVKPNCSIQSYVPVLHALRAWGPKQAVITTLQAISGAGKTFESWPEMVDNVIPLIKGEEDKSEKEPLKIWGSVKNGVLEIASSPKISATCIRVPVSDGHMASVSVSFDKKPTRAEVLEALRSFENPLASLGLPSAPKQLITYFEDEARPQTKLDRDDSRGMGITVGRLREDPLLDWKFVALSHNTVRGAAGGAILTAELLKAKGYIKPQ